MLRGSVAHTTLHRFYAGLPKAVGSDRVEESRLDDALAFLSECLEGALGGVKMEMTELERRELEQSLRRDLEQFVRDEARSELPLVPRRFEVGFGSERSAPELQRGLDLGDGITLSGKIDRIDVDPGSARGIVQDYKSGRTGHSAVEIEKELRLQIPLYMLVLRDLVGIEPLGGLYRPLAGERRARGLLRAEAKDDGCRASRRTTTSTRRRSGRRSTARASWRAASRSASGRATCGTTRRGGRLSGLVRPLADVPDQARSEQRAERAAGRGDRGARAGLRLGRCGHRQDDGARRALRRGGVRARARRRVDARDHVHGACGRGAARPDPRAAARAGPARSRALARRRLDLDDPRLLPAPAEGAPVRGRPRPALPRARRQPGPRDPRRGVRGGAERVLRGGRAGAAAAARDLRRGGAAPDADERLRDPALGRPRARARARRAAGPRRAARGAGRGRPVSRGRCRGDRRARARPPRRRSS